MESGMDYWAAKAALDWQVELGATEAIGDTPVDCYALEAVKPKPVANPAQAAAQSAAQGTPGMVKPLAEPDQTAIAAQLAAGADSIDALRAAIGNFEGCELKRGARKMVFADGTPGARVMVIGDAPGREEDREGRPFVGAAGSLFDKMFDAIGMARVHDNVAQCVYITPVLPWRPPSGRDPNGAEITMMLPFLQRHIALAKPDFLVLMGNISCQALLGKRGISRLRGTWVDVAGIPALPMFNPAYLLDTPAAKRAAWADLLALRARMENGK